MTDNRPLPIATSAETDDHPLSTATPAPAAEVPSSSPDPSLRSRTRFPRVPLSFPTLPAPTVPPPGNWQDAYTFQRNGDYDRAIDAYRALLNSQSPDDQARAALFHLGQTYFLAGKHAEAVQTLEQFLVNYPQDGQAGRAQLLLGASHQALGDPSHLEAAVAAFAAYRDRGTPLVDYADIHLGQVLTALGRTADAVTAFQHALDSGASGTAALDALKGMGRAYLTQKQFDQAAAVFQKAASFAEDKAQRADLGLAAGQAYASVGQIEQAAAQFQAVVIEYPETGAALTALQELAQLGDTGLRPYLQGLVYYYNRDYPAAIAAFKRVDAGNADAVAAHFYAGEAYRRLRQYDQAIREFDAILTGYPKDSRVAQAWLNKGRSLSALNRTDQAIQVYRRLADALPNDPLADDALWAVALTTEESAGCDRALAAYQAVGQRYPRSEFAGRAYFNAGLCRYKLGHYDDAIAAWQPMASQDDPATRSKGLFWLAKAHLALGKPDKADTLLADAVAVAVKGYYGLRAATLRDAGLKATPPASGPARQADFETWFLARTGRSAADLQDTDTAILADRGFQRGIEFMALGLRADANREFRAVRGRFFGDALAMVRLAIRLRDQESYALSISCAERAAHLLGLDMTQAPRFLQVLAYPRPYRDLVEAESARRGLDPLLFYALIRQESRFEPLSLSSAQARGLTQVIPSTALGIAQSLRWSGFRQEDLLKPYVSVAFGTHYLSEMLKQFNGVPQLALAAYNGGPGNARRWQRLGSDLDLAVEAIDLSETALYVRTVTEQYAMYQSLYGP